MAGIFQPNAHSKWEIILHDASVEDAEHVAEIAERIGNPLPVKVWEIKEGMNSANFVAEHKSGVSLPLLLYRCNRIPHPLHELEWTSLLLEYLAENNVSVPRPLRCNGAAFTVMYGESVWQCSEYIRSDGHFRGDFEELVSAGKEIGRLHHALAAYPRANECPTKLLGSLDWAVWEEGLDTIPESVFGTMVRERKTLLRKLIDEVNTRSGEPSRGQLIHADIHPQNLLCRDSRVVSIIDFDALSYGPRALDLANACHRLVRQAVCFGQEEPRSAINRLVHGFLSAYSSECEIHSSELVALPSYMREIILRKIATNIELLSVGIYTDSDSVEKMERWVILLDEVNFLEKNSSVFS